MHSDDCLKTNSIPNYMNSRVKRKSEYIQKGQKISKYNMQTNTDNDGKT